jgi:tellurite resistance protein TehA-like permease
MKMPWEGKSRPAKTTTFLATLLLVSIGLCAANEGVHSLLDSRFGSSQSGLATFAEGAIVVTGILEFTGIAIGLVGLIIVAIRAVLLWILEKLLPPKDAQKPE